MVFVPKAAGCLEGLVTNIFQKSSTQFSLSLPSPVLTSVLYIYIYVYYYYFYFILFYFFNLCFSDFFFCFVALQVNVASIILLRTGVGQWTYVAVAPPVVFAKVPVQLYPRGYDCSGQQIMSMVVFCCCPCRVATVPISCSASSVVVFRYFHGYGETIQKRAGRVSQKLRLA